MVSNRTITEAEKRRRLAAAYKILLDAADRIAREKTAQAQGARDAKDSDGSGQGGPGYPGVVCFLPGNALPASPVQAVNRQFQVIGDEDQ